MDIGSYMYDRSYYSPYIGSMSFWLIRNIDRSSCNPYEYPHDSLLSSSLAHLSD